jgi:acetylornithine/N-succinyldiaminopimelate aminotransferase
MIPAVMPVYANRDIALVRGEGCYAWDSDGRRYLDFSTGVAVTGLGHCHPRLVAALAKQANTLWHTSNLYRVPGQESLAAKLVAHTFADTVFFTNSGVEAWEGAVKLVRKYQSAIGQPQRWRVISATGAFHGRTLAACAAAKSGKMVDGFGPMVDGFDQVAFGNLNELRAAITDETAGICIEPVQGEGGVRPATPEYLHALRTVCDEFGLLLLFDEIQCGYGRTGKLFAHEWSGVIPDVMCVAKGIGSGFPVGAFMATEKAAVGMTAGTHGSTYGGNPLAMAVANEVFDIVMEPGFLDRVNQTAGDLWAGLQEITLRYPTVMAEMRGLGLLIGLKPHGSNAALQAAMRKRGLLTVLASDNVIRLLPQLIAGKAEIAEALAAIDGACAEIAAGGGAA